MSILVNPYCTFKTLEVERRTNFLCDTALDVLDAMAEYCKDLGIPFEITDSVSTAAEDKALARVSDEHRTARAFDMSIHGWTDASIANFIYQFEKQFMCVAAIGKISGQPKLIFRHDVGHGDHLHVQVARIFGITNPLG